MCRGAHLFGLLLVVGLGGCTTPKADVSGTFKSENPPATLTIGDKKFKLQIDANTVEGETSQQLSHSLYLHPKTLNGRTEEEATMKAMRDAQEMGVVADMEIQGTVFTTIALTVSEDGKTLTFEDKPTLGSGKQPYYNALNTMSKQ